MATVTDLTVIFSLRLNLRGRGYKFPCVCCHAGRGRSEVFWTSFYKSPCGFLKMAADALRYTLHIRPTDKTRISTVAFLRIRIEMDEAREEFDSLRYILDDPVQLSVLDRLESEFVNLFMDVVLHLNGTNLEGPDIDQASAVMGRITWWLRLFIEYKHALPYLDKTLFQISGGKVLDLIPDDSWYRAIRAAFNDFLLHRTTDCHGAACA